MMVVTMMLCRKLLLVVRFILWSGSLRMQFPVKGPGSLLTTSVSRWALALCSITPALMS